MRDLTSKFLLPPQQRGLLRVRRPIFDVRDPPQQVPLMEGLAVIALSGTVHVKDASLPKLVPDMMNSCCKEED